MSTRFFFVKPTLLATAGYAYGSSGGPAAGASTATLTRLNLGRWAYLTDTAQADVQWSQLVPREVSEEEALCGIGSYVGTYVCVPRNSEDGTEVWDYGVVTSYRWAKGSKEGFLRVRFSKGTAEVRFDSDVFQELALETYALRPCAGATLADIMPGEMRDLHQRVYEHFNGNGRPATRSSKAILQRAGRPLVEEREPLPIFDFARGAVVLVETKYALDYVYYKDGDRRAPKSVRLGDSLLDGEIRAPPLGKTPRSRRTPDALSSSEDDEDLDEATATTPDEDAPLTATAKKRRIATHAGTRAAGDSLTGGPLTGHRGVEKEIDELLTLRQGGVGRADPMWMRGPDSKTQFVPTALQTSVHQAIVSGKFALYSPQLSVERTQTSWETLDLWPHPAAIRLFHSWEFGLRGLSVLHFAPWTDDEKLTASQGVDMIDFSLRNKLVPARPAQKLEDLIEAAAGLERATDLLFDDKTTSLVREIRRFVGGLQTTHRVSDAEVVRDMVKWVDRRLAMYRMLLACGDEDPLGQVLAQVSVAHPSFVQVLQIATERRFALLERGGSRQAAEATSNRSDGPAAPRANGAQRGPRRPDVPASIVRALPSQNGKSLCMKHLAKNGCRGEGANCAFSYRAHFKPRHLAPEVRAFIEKNYGGLKPEFQDL